MNGVPCPIIATHGSLSLTVNLCALGLSRSRPIDTEAGMNDNGGSTLPYSFALHTPQRFAPLDVCLVCDGLSSSSMPLTIACFDISLCRLGGHDIFVIRDNIENAIIARYEWMKLHRRVSTAVQHHEMQKKHENEVEASLHHAESDIPIEVIYCLCQLSVWDPDVLQQFVTQMKSYFDLSSNNSKELPKIESIILKRFVEHEDDFRDGIVSYFDGNNEQKTVIETLLPLIKCK